MNMDNIQLFERLTEIKKLSAEKNYRLAKTEQEECINTLFLLIQSGFEYVEKAVAALPELPSDVGAVILADTWEHLRKQQFPIIETLHSEMFSSILCKRLRLLLSYKLLSFSQNDAIRVLIDTFQDMKQPKKIFPTVKDLKQITTTLLHKKNFPFQKLLIPKDQETHIQLLVNYFLAAGFITKNKDKIICSPEEQLNLLQWTRAFNALIYIPSEIVKGITSALEQWDTDHKILLFNGVDSMHVSIRKAVQPHTRTDPTQPQKDDSQSKTIMGLPNQEDQSKPQYDPLVEVNRLADYIKKQDIALREKTEKLKEAKLNLDSKQSELKGIGLEKEKLKRQLANEKEDLNESVKQREKLVIDRDKVIEELNIVKKALKDAADQHKSAIQKYDQQLDILSERIAREGDHRINAFKKKLESKLKVYAQNLEEVNDMEITVEIGNALQIQLKQILKILKSEGINILGDS